MSKGKVPYVLIVIAMILNILSYDFSNEIGNTKFWFFIGAVLLLAVSLVMLFKKDE